MLGKQLMLEQYAYNDWANGKIFAEAVLVDPGQLNASSPVEGRSLYDILIHLVRVEKVWRLIVQTGAVDPQALPDEERMPTALDLADFFSHESAALGEYLHAVDEKSLAEEIMIHRWDGQEMTYLRYQLLQHLFMHSMQHRSEAAVLLTQYGHSPGNIDALFFFDM